jgi:FkbM family methyltransferase
MPYSQNNEEAFLLAHFRGKTDGHLLSLGENDGMTLSNARALISQGWTADLFEPAPEPFKKLKQLYKPDDKFIEIEDRIRLYNMALGNKTGMMPFYESGSLLNSGDTDLVSTLDPEETKRWNGTVDFKMSEVYVVTFADYLNEARQRTFDFISIDCEGFDWIILQQMNLKDLQCQCLCVEFNGKNEHMFNSYARQFGMYLAHKNQENLIYVR